MLATSFARSAATMSHITLVYRLNWAISKLLGGIAKVWYLKEDAYIKLGSELILASHSEEHKKCWNFKPTIPKG